MDQKKTPIEAKDGMEASRTLFVGCLPDDIEESELRAAFKLHGNIEYMEIRRPVTESAYAFVVFQTMEEAKAALAARNDTPIRPLTRRCRIGYGKTLKSRRIVIGCLEKGIDEELLRLEFGRFGVIDNIEFHSGDENAYIRFHDQESATEATKTMNGFVLGGCRNPIIVDYSKSLSSEEMDRKRKSSSSTSADTPLPTEKKWTKSIISEKELMEDLACTWIGKLVLKKTEYKIRLWRVEGCERQLQLSLRDDDGLPLNLPIIQRMGAAKFDYLKNRVMKSKSEERTVMLATGKERDLTPVVQYLKKKNGTGVIALEDCNVYIFPHDANSAALLNHFAPFIRIFTAVTNHLLVILLRHTALKVTK